MMQAAAAQMAHFYRVPIYGSGGMTDSKLPDAQAGYEKMATLMLAAMGGCNFIHHAVGMITNMASASLEQAVIDDEIIGMARQVLNGIPVTPDTLAGEAIQEVGPGGHFLLADHTVRNMRSAVFYPQVADRQSRASWEAAGKSDTRQRAVARVKHILAQQRPANISTQVDRAIRQRFDIQLADPA
jgi:trimethylamine--corrinoid protein Co-methyltransferase